MLPDPWIISRHAKNSKAKEAGQPLWRLLGGRDRTVAAYASGLDIALSDDELVSVYQAYAARGLRSAKLKGGLDVERDLRRLLLVRDVLAEAHPGSRPGLMIDANEIWTRKQAVRHVAELERSVDLIWVAEPVRRWDAEGLATVGRGVRASVAGGENLTGLEQFRPLLAAGALDIVQTGAGWGSPTSSASPRWRTPTTFRSAPSAPRPSGCCTRRPPYRTTCPPSSRTSNRRRD